MKNKRRLILSTDALVLGLALSSMLAAAVPALVVAFGLDAMGIRSGMGNANTAKVAGLAFPAATFSAGLLIGRYLARYQN